MGGESLLQSVSQILQIRLQTRYACQSQSPDSELWTPERVQATWKEEVDRAARKKVEENRKAEEDLERELWNQNVIKDMERLKEKGIKMNWRLRLPPQSQSKP